MHWFISGYASNILDTLLQHVGIFEHCRAWNTFRTGCADDDARPWQQKRPGISIRLPHRRRERIQVSNPKLFGCLTIRDGCSQCTAAFFNASGLGARGLGNASPSCPTRAQRPGASRSTRFEETLSDKESC
eukprot:jgi/Ulvmu1/8798/UM048_0053.1